MPVMANSTSSTLPPLPSYTLTLLQPLIPGIDDTYLSTILLLVAYWTTSLVFHVIDIYDLFPQYRLHTPAEVLKRNRVGRFEVFRDVIIQQIVQTAFVVLLAAIDPPQMTGKEQYDIAWWAQCVRIAQSWIPQLLKVAGVDAMRLATSLDSSQHAMLTGMLAGGVYPQLTQSMSLHGHVETVPAFAQWELFVAKAIYHVGVPALQFFVAVIIVDAWQYGFHRAMHMNKWLYVKLHSRHHRLYVPYAYGALYNHPIEGFLLDTLGTGLAYLVTGMTVRQSMWFFTLTTIKTVDDHCGYAFPWDPFQLITSNNAAYHDIHHQSWGIKTNFSQPYFTFWDTLLGTKWTGGDVSARYEKARVAAQCNDDATVQAVTPNPYKELAAQASTTAREAHNAFDPQIPSGKATEQALASRQITLEVHGTEPFVTEAREEERVRKTRSRKA